MMKKRKGLRFIKDNSQIIKLKAINLQKPAKTSRYDSTLEERERTQDVSKAEPRLTEYR